MFNTGGSGVKQCNMFAATHERAVAAWRYLRWCRALRALEIRLCSAAVRQARLGVHAINRLSSAPRSGMGSGEQSAAEEGKEGAGRPRHQAKTPSTRPRADRLRLTLSSGCNTIKKSVWDVVFVLSVRILHPRAQSCPWPERGETKHARLPQREPGSGSQQRLAPHLPRPS